jgi:hypothetical protein
MEGKLTAVCSANGRRIERLVLGEANAHPGLERREDGWMDGLLFCVNLSGKSQNPTHLDVKINLYETSDNCSVMCGSSDVYEVVSK